MDTCPVIRVKPWSKDQGDFVEINFSDFDPAVHTVVAGESEPVPEAPVVPASPVPVPAKPRVKRRRKGK